MIFFNAPGWARERATGHAKALLGVADFGEGICEIGRGF
jgi:hypothetical protein